MDDGSWYQTIDVVKILAIGYKRFMWVWTYSGVFCVRINDKIYSYLKAKGVPTCQSMRRF